MEAQGGVMTNKYAEGYPGRRYYGGCEYVDVAEAIAIERAKKLFDCEFVNVQPHSGAQANGAVMMALVEPGATILGMSLAAGGHLTHGAPPAQSGKWFNAIQYGVRHDDHLVDFDEVESLTKEHKPKLIICGGSAYPRTFDFARFREIADSVGAYLMVDMAHFAGLVTTGVHPSPLPHAHIVTTTTHKTLRGPRGGMILSNDADLGKKINSAVFPGLQGGPLMHVIAAKAVAFGEALRPEFKTYSQAVAANAKVLAQVLIDRGCDIVSGGTDTHLMLVDLRPKNLGLNNLAALYRNQGRYTDAEPLYKRSLAIWEKALGPEHPDVALGLNNLAALYRNQGRYTDAEPLLKRSLAIREKALGPGPSAENSRFLALIARTLPGRCQQPTKGNLQINRQSQGESYDETLH